MVPYITLQKKNCNRDGLHSMQINLAYEKKKWHLLINNNVINKLVMLTLKRQTVNKMEG